MLPREALAQRSGAAIARRFGMTELPVDPFTIAAEEGIRLRPLPAGEAGVSGVFLFTGVEVGILYRQAPHNPGFERFSLAHELGHYFIEGHPEMIARAGGRHESHAGFRSRRQAIEVEADQFAASLLMPAGSVRALLSKMPVGLDAIAALKDRAIVSMTAAAIACARHADHPLAIIVSRGHKVDYAFLSESFRKLGRLTFPRKGQPIPAGATAGFGADPDKIRKGRRAVGQCRLGDWFDSARDLELDEEVIGLGRSGRILTVLSSENLPRGEDADYGQDEDADLKRRWTPGFR